MKPAHAGLDYDRRQVTAVAVCGESGSVGVERSSLLLDVDKFADDQSKSQAYRSLQDRWEVGGLAYTKGW